MEIQEYINNLRKNQVVDLEGRSDELQPGEVEWDSIYRQTEHGYAASLACNHDHVVIARHVVSLTSRTWIVRHLVCTDCGEIVKNGVGVTR